MEQVDARIVRQLFWLGTKTAAGQDNNIQAGQICCLPGSDFQRWCLIWDAGFCCGYVGQVLRSSHHTVMVMYVSITLTPATELLHICLFTVHTFISSCLNLQQSVVWHHWQAATEAATY